jgi:hypothetical protein
MQKVSRWCVRVLPLLVLSIAAVAGVKANSSPTITSLSPPSAYVNSAGFTLTINGTGFQSGAVVYWNNVGLATTFVSSTKLTAPVSASDLSVTGEDWVSVTNPDGGYTGIIYFNVVNLDPFLSSVAPTFQVAGTTPATIIVNGSSFMNGATIQWNGKSLTTAYLSSSQLQATPSPQQVAAASIVQISVSNPPPGGISPVVDFDVTYPAKVTTLDLPANDLIWDPYAQRIYASLPSSYGVNGNTIAVINPVSGKVTGYFFAGSEPNQVALSSDSKYLYVGLNGNGSVQRLILPSFTADIDVSLGTSYYGGLNLAANLLVSPSDDHTFAVAEGSSSCCGSGTGVFFYKDSTLLADSVTYPAFNSLVWPTSGTMYGYYSGTVGEITVDSNGGILGQQWNSLVEGSTIQYANGLIYGNAGQSFNPSTGLLVGTYDVAGPYCCSYNPLLPDSAINRVLVAGTTPFSTQFGITAYDLSRFTPIAVANLSQLNGTPIESFIRWGNNGLAFVLLPNCCNGGANQIILVQSSSLLATASSTKNPPPFPSTLSPASATHGGFNFRLTVQGKNFVPGSTVTWNGKSLFADYVSSTQLNVYVPAAEIAGKGTASVVVQNPAPGGGAATPLTFTIN